MRLAIRRNQFAIFIKERKAVVGVAVFGFKDGTTEHDAMFFGEGAEAREQALPQRRGVLRPVFEVGTSMQ